MGKWEFPNHIVLIRKEFIHCHRLALHRRIVVKYNHAAPDDPVEQLLQPCLCGLKDIRIDM